MPEWLVFLVMVAVFAALAMAARFPIGIALALAAVAGSLFAGKGVSVRHLIEGGFGYFDTILIIITATDLHQGPRGLGHPGHRRRRRPQSLLPEPRAPAARRSCSS